MCEEQEKQSERLREERGIITSESKLTCFLYLLLRDKLPAGEVYEVKPATIGSLWQESNRVDEIHERSFPVIKNMGNCIGQNLSLYEIEQRLKEPERFRSSRALIR